MVRRLCPKKIFWLAITVLVIANLTLGSYVFAKQFEIKAEDVERIKTALGMAQTVATVADIIINNKDLATVLNTIISGSKTGVDITYGLVVLGALNEMDLVDLVVSGRYRDEARDYFNSVLDQTTNLTSYWKGTSQNIFSLMKSGSAVTPTTGLAAESVAILEKTMSIIVSANVWMQVETYNGMWRYFQDRMNGDTHKDAWYFAEGEMGYVPDQADSNQLEGWSHNTASYREKQIIQLEQQFLTLYNNWEPYVTPFGISEKYKKQVKEELSDALITALKENAALAKNEPETSLIDKLAQQLAKLKEATADLLSKINPFKAGVVLNLPPEELIEAGPQSIEVQPLSIKEPLPIITDAELIEVGPQSIEIEPLDEADIIKQSAPEEIIEPEIKQLITTTTTPELLASTTEPVPMLELPPVLAPKLASTPEPVFCDKKAGDLPRRYRVFINEVAWMGTADSTNNEWIELKNIWGIPVKLSGWQLLDKDRQIKIVFSEDAIIPAGGYYLLERTDDNSMPDARADLIYTGALGNTNEALYLFDSNCQLEDEVLANPNWPAGDNSLKKPMARFDVLDWYVGVSPPGGENSPPPIISAAAGASVPLPEPSSASIQILITETYIGSSDNQQDDFVELYNPNLKAIDLTDWYLRRKTAGAQDFSSYAPHELLSGKAIGARDYFLIANASSTFATSADVVTTYPLTANNTLVLKNNQREIISQVSTDNPTTGKSYGRKWSSTTLNYTEDFEAQIPTPRTQNQNSVTEEDGSEEESLSVVINEIAWAGTEANQWLELFVNSTTTLDGWKILGSKNGTTTLEIPLSGFASSSTYVLIETTDDNTISDISANFFFTGSLDNDGMKLELWDSNNVLIDSVDCSSGWFAGDNATKQTMERIAITTGTDPQNWASNNLITKNGLDASGNSVNGTPKSENSVAKEYTTLSGGITFDENFVLRRLGSPYISDGPINVLSGVTLSIEPGVIIKLKHGSSRTPYAELKVEGSLEALGGSEPDQKIVFTSYRDDEYGGDTNNDGNATQPTAGDWDWVYFKDSVSHLQNVIVRYGGKLHTGGGFTSYTYGAIYIDGGKLTISSSTVEKSATLGIWINNSSTTQISGTEFKNIDTSWSVPAAIYIESSSPTISGSTFTGNNLGVLVENFASPAVENNIFNNNRIPIQINTLLPTVADNTFNNNHYNGVYVVGLSLPEGQTSMVWKEAGIPYIINTLTLAPGLALQIEPGVIIKFLSNGRLNIEGDFEANGTTTNKIVFTSIQDDEYGDDTNNDGAITQAAAGRWHYVSFANSSINPILENVIIRYGGWYNVFQGGIDAKSGAVKTTGASLTIRNSLFENNLFAGLEIVNATTTVENTAFNKNEHGIYITSDTSECPNLSGAIFGEGENANSIKVFPENCTP